MIEEDNNIDFLPEDDFEITKESENSELLYEHYRYVADKGQGPLRVDIFLSTRIEGASRNRLQKAAAAKFILVNGIPVK